MNLSKEQLEKYKEINEHTINPKWQEFADDEQSKMFRDKYKDLIDKHNMEVYGFTW